LQKAGNVSYLPLDKKQYCVATDRSIKNLIFDLGGVILDLSVDSTLQSFSELAKIDHTTVKKLFISSKGFESYEKGEISDAEFRDFVRKLYNIDASDEKLDACWNAMLLDIPLEKLKLLETLKTKYNVYLLSNTNNIHVHYINTILLPRIEKTSLDDFFHRSFYSHQMKKRKPDLEIFQEVLDEGNFKPEETLFLDDNSDNVQGAGKLGIKTVHVVNPDMILDYFNEQ
jgi:putative hydrolase of the HAD superfamily